MGSTSNDRALLDAIALARQTKDYRPLNRWGGVMEAARAVARIQTREEPDAAPSTSIDSHSTHIAARLAPDTLDL